MVLLKFLSISPKVIILSICNINPYVNSHLRYRELIMATNWILNAPKADYENYSRFVASSHLRCVRTNLSYQFNTWSQFNQVRIGHYSSKLPAC